jgi:hypothetical protein
MIDTGTRIKHVQMVDRLLSGLMNARKYNPDRRPPKTGARVCLIEGCGITTREQKLHCVEHAPALGYAAVVAAKLRAYEAEVARASMPNAVITLRSILVQEIAARMIDLDGIATCDRLARLTELPCGTILRIVRCMEDAGFLEVTISKRRAIRHNTNKNRDVPGFTVRAHALTCVPKLMG